MKNLISYNRALKFSLIMTEIFAGFHFLIILVILIFNIVPVDYLWGGRMQTKEELLVFEFVSLFVMLFIILVLKIHSRQLNWPRLWVVSRIFLWLLSALFSLNTIGNLLAKSNFEKLFAILTFTFALLSIRMAIEKKIKRN